MIPSRIWQEITVEQTTESFYPGSQFDIFWISLVAGRAKYRKVVLLNCIIQDFLFECQPDA